MLIDVSTPSFPEKFAIVDDDADDILRHVWSYRHDGYVVRGDGRNTFLLHREVVNAPKGTLVDHINGNRLDCRRSNLRVVTMAENNRNARGRGGSSEYKGVTLCKGKWLSRICVDGRRIRLGLFESEVEAAKAYDAAARKYHGEYAWLNFK